MGSQGSSLIGPQTNAVSPDIVIGRSPQIFKDSFPEANLKAAINDLHAQAA